VDHEGEVLESVATKRRNKRAALKMLRKLMRRYGQPDALVTDRLPSYRAALGEFGWDDLQACGRWLNNRAEYSPPARHFGRRLPQYWGQFCRPGK